MVYYIYFIFDRFFSFILILKEIDSLIDTVHGQTKNQAHSFFKLLWVYNPTICVDHYYEIKKNDDIIYSGVANKIKWK